MNNDNGQSIKAFILAAVVGLVVGCTSGEKTPPSTSRLPTPPTTFVATPQPESTTATTVAPLPPVGMNEEARDGMFVFKVLQAYTKKAFDKSVPQGIYLIVSFDVTNIDKGSQRFFADYQRLVDRQQRKYSPDLSATTLQYADSGFHNPVDIYPDSTTDTVLAFDVPAGTQPSDYLLSLHGSPDSVGATVRLK